MSEKTGVSLIDRTRDHDDRKALIAPEGVFTYADLMNASAAIADDLLQDTDDLDEARVAFLLPPGFRYTAALWGIWRAGGLAVPLAVSHPRPELEYAVDDSDAAILVATPEFEDRLRPIAQDRGLRLVIVDQSGSATAR